MQETFEGLTFYFSHNIILYSTSGNWCLVSWKLNKILMSKLLQETFIRVWSYWFGAKTSTFCEIIAHINILKTFNSFVRGSY